MFVESKVSATCQGSRMSFMDIADYCSGRVDRVSESYSLSFGLFFDPVVPATDRYEQSQNFAPTTGNDG